MNSARASITTLLIGTAILFLGTGLQQIIVPVRAKLEAFSTTTVGVMGAAYFGGFAVGCVIGPLFVRRVGHIRCFAGFAALAASGTLAFPLAVDPIAWSVLRAHLSNEGPHLIGSFRSTTAPARLPAPIDSEAFAMPSHQRLGMDNANQLCGLRP